MRISGDLVDEIVAHAREDAPNECCGMVGGIDGEARTVYRARNAFESPMRFEIHPTDQYEIVEKRMPAAGEELQALYHSHPHSEAEPSQTDINLAELWPGTVWVICSLAEADPIVRAFLIEGEAVREVGLEPA